MKWIGRRQSGNINDQRGSGGGRIPGGIMGKGGLVVVVIVVIISLITGKNPLSLLEQTGITTDNSSVEQQSYTPTAEEEELAQFVRVVLADTEDVWNKLMENYREPTLVLFTEQVESGCGSASAASGPFYCPTDEKVYIDLSFYSDLKSRLGAPGDFAQAYVIAHEIGHHVQNLLGISDKVQNMRGQLSEEENNAMSVKLELQADFLAGVWAHYADQMNNIIEPGDFEEALNAANAIGDDRLQKQGQGYVVPDSFTHGTSEQRMRWFRKGYETGDTKQGDTFSLDENEL